MCSGEATSIDKLAYNSLYAQMRLNYLFFLLYCTDTHGKTFFAKSSIIYLVLMKR